MREITRETYLDCDDAWLRALTRAKRQEYRAARLANHHTIRFSAQGSVEFQALVTSASSGISRRKTAAKRWVLRQWQEGVRNCFYCDDPMIRTPQKVRSRPTFMPGPREATCDHRIPLALGGMDAACNWVMACWSCNNAKGQMSEAEFRATISPASRPRVAAA